MLCLSSGSFLLDCEERVGLVCDTTHVKTGSSRRSRVYQIVDLPQESDLSIITYYTPTVNFFFSIRIKNESAER